MTWSRLLSEWRDHIPEALWLFPHLDPQALARFRGDRGLLATYLAETHDLTLSEAQDCINDRLLALSPARLSVAAPQAVGA